MNTHRRSSRRGLGLLALAVVVLVIGTALIVKAMAGSSSQPSSDGSTAQPTPASSGASPMPWDKTQLARFDAVNALLATKKGHIGLVVQDRQTGAIWRGGETGTRIWSGSIPKLAFALALKEGKAALDATAQAQIAAMLSVSDNNAADALWNRYVPNPDAMMATMRSYGMTNATYVDGFPKRWGFVKCTAEDLRALMAHILTLPDQALRNYFVSAMQSVGAVQHWGVWGAGAALQPGVKNGWSVEKDDGQDHWITATVGFVGKDQRYIVTGMYHQLPGGDTIAEGVHALTDAVATAFGATVPAPVVIPSDY